MLTSITQDKVSTLLARPQPLGQVDEAPIGVVEVRLLQNPRPSDGIRTRVLGTKSRCPGPLDDGERGCPGPAMTFVYTEAWRSL